MRRIFLLPIIFTLFLFPCLAQQTKNQIKKIEEEKPFDIKDYKGWQKIELNAFTFYAPNLLKKKETKCIEGGCYKFESENLSLNIDINIDAGYPTFEKNYPTYLEKYVRIDNSFAWIWSFEHDGIYKYESSVLFQLKKKKNDYRIGMYLFSKNEDIKEMGEKIFKSVKFK